MKIRSILFVCAGNTCRSPMAVVIAKSLLPKSIFVDSAGVAAKFNDEANQHAQRAVASLYGFDLAKHRAKSVSSINLKNYDCIVALDRSVTARLKKDWQVDEDHLLSLEIADPYDNGETAYTDTAHTLHSEITRLLSVWINDSSI